MVLRGQRGCFMGQSRTWWRQLCNPRSADESATGSRYKRCICCNPGRWFRVTWGDPDCGGDISRDQDQLPSVQQVQATKSLFYAFLQDGSVVSWGRRDYGNGFLRREDDELRNMKQIQATKGAYAAILQDGFFVAWGHQECGGDSSAVQDQLRSVQQVQATNVAFAAILEDGSLVTWGNRAGGGDSSDVQDQLRSVQQVQTTELAFAAILEDGSVVTWGPSDYGGKCAAVQNQLRSVQQIQATARAFAAVLEDGSVVWGNPAHGGDSSAVQDQLMKVHKRCICCNPGRWFRRDMGRSGLWWWHLSSPRSADESATGSRYKRCICCNPGRWFRRDMGRSGLWWWHLSSPRSAEKSMISAYTEELMPLRLTHSYSLSRACLCTDPSEKSVQAILRFVDMQSSSHILHLEVSSMLDNIIQDLVPSYKQWCNDWRSLQKKHFIYLYIVVMIEIW